MALVSTAGITDAVVEALRSWDSSAGTEAGAAALQAALAGADGAEIVSTLKALKEMHGVVQAAREAGQSREDWLTDKLTPLLGTNGTEVLSTALMPLGLAKGSSISALSQRWLDIGQEAVSLDLQGIGSAVTTAAETLPRLRSFLERPLGEETAEDADLMAVAASAACKVLRVTHGSSVEASVVACTAGVALQSAKVAYQIGTDVISAGEGVAYLEDHIAAVAGALVEHAVATHAETAGAMLGAWLGNYAGMAPIGQTIGAAVGRLVGTKLAPLIGQGVRAVVKMGLQRVRPLGGKLTNWITG